MFLFVDVAFVREVRGIQTERKQFNDAFAGEGCVCVKMDRCSICVQWQRWRQAQGYWLKVLTRHSRPSSGLVGPQCL